MSYIKTARFIIYLVPLTVAIVSKYTLFPFIVGKYSFFRAAVGLALIFVLLEIITGSHSQYYWQRFIKIIKTPLAIALGVFTFFFVLAGFFGIDPSYSFWSNFERGEGSLQIIFLYIYFLLLMVLLRSKNDWRKFLWMFLLGAFLMVFYGIGAGLKYIDADTTEVVRGGVKQTVLTGEGGPLFQTFKGFIGPSFSEPSFRFQGSIGNPAYVAAYLIFVVFFAAYLLFSKKIMSKAHKLILILSIVFFGFFFVTANTRAAFLGLGVGILVGMVYLIFTKKSWRVPLITILILGSILLGMGFRFKDTSLVQRIPGSRIFSISLTAETFKHRLIMWGIAFDGWKKRPILGWGPENYDEIFYRYYNPKYYVPGAGYGAWFDRAHNIFFDYLAETGLLGLISYLSIYLVLLMTLLRRKKEETQSISPLMRALFLALPAAYLIQGLALFEVLVIYLPLFTFFALSNFYFMVGEEG